MDDGRDCASTILPVQLNANASTTCTKYTEAVVEIIGFRKSQRTFVHVRYVLVYRIYLVGIILSYVCFREQTWSIGVTQRFVRFTCADCWAPIIICFSSLIGRSDQINIQRTPTKPPIRVMCALHIKSHLKFEIACYSRLTTVYGGVKYISRVS
jgi:hypothetical protein